MWEIHGTPIDPIRFTPFEPLEILNYYDGPRVFTFLDSDNGLCLACWNNEDDIASRFIVVPCTAETISRLKRGIIPLKKALDQARIWTVDIDQQGNIVEVRLVSLENIPEDSLPRLGARLIRKPARNDTAVFDGESSSLANSGSNLEHRREFVATPLESERGWTFLARGPTRGLSIPRLERSARDASNQLPVGFEIKELANAAV